MTTPEGYSYERLQELVAEQVVRFQVAAKKLREIEEREWWDDITSGRRAERADATAHLYPKRPTRAATDAIFAAWLKQCADRKFASAGALLQALCEANHGDPPDEAARRIRQAVLAGQLQRAPRVDRGHPFVRVRMASLGSGGEDRSKCHVLGFDPLLYGYSPARVR